MGWESKRGERLAECVRACVRRRTVDREATVRRSLSSEPICRPKDADVSSLICGRGTVSYGSQLCGTGAWARALADYSVGVALAGGAPPAPGG